jgi:CheY-like chemotaxis protein
MAVLVQPFVVIVEDYDDSREVFTECLKSGGFDVAGFACAEDALASFVGRAPDAVVTDLTLPGMSGEEFALHLQGEPSFARIPVFALSGRALEGKAAAVFAGTLLKPVNLESLVSQLRRLLLSSAGPEVS